MNYKIKLAIILFALGTLGILSLLTVTIPIDNLPKQVLDKFTPETIQLLTLINPSILLVVSVIVGTILFDKVQLNVPTIRSILKSKIRLVSILEQLKFGIIGGICTGIFTFVVAFLFKFSLPQEYRELSEKFELSIPAKILYGGITEELLIRFGLMTLVIWLIYKATKKLNSTVYWSGIILSSILFSVGHLPIILNIIQNPTLTVFLYIIITNLSAGVFFGWLYWKKGLESAFIAHSFAHLTIIIGEKIF